MKKKLLPLLLTLTLVLCSCVGLAACKDKDETPAPAPDPAPTLYKVTVASGTGFTVAGINADGYAKGATVSFTVTVTDNAKELGSVKVDGNAVTAQSNGHYEFSMPEKDVEISVTLADKAPVLSADKAKVTLNVKDDDNKSAEVTVSVTNAPASYELTFVSADDSIASVSHTGNVGTITAVAKGNTTITISMNDNANVQPITVNVAVKEFRPWTAEEVSAMEEHLHGIVLEPTNVAGMEARWDSELKEVIVEGGEVEGSDLAEYAAEYTEEDGWIDVSHLYNVPEGTAYMFEKGVETEDGTRYVRVFIYAVDDDNDFALEGALIIEAYDPYVYECPEVFIEGAPAYFLSEIKIPTPEAQHYFYYGAAGYNFGTDYQYNTYTLNAYYASTEPDGGYGAILEAAHFTVKAVEDYYVAISPDGLYSITYGYADGMLELNVSAPIADAWDANVIDKHFDAWASKGAEKYGAPAFEGENLSFVFVEYTYNNSALKDKIERHGAVFVLGSTQALTDAYGDKLKTAGWTEINGNAGAYQKVIRDGYMVARIEVSFNAENNYTRIKFFYALRVDTTQGWLASEVAKLTKYLTDPAIIPQYEGEIVEFSVTPEYIYVTVPAEDHNGIADRYGLTLTNAGYTKVNNFGRYQSPDSQFELTVSQYAGPNQMSIRYAEIVNTPWSAERIQGLLQRIGSSIDSIPTVVLEKDFKCTYSVTSSNVIDIRVIYDDGSSMTTEEELAAYKAIIEADPSWTFVPPTSPTSTLIQYVNNSTQLSINIHSSGNLRIQINVLASK